MKIGPFTGIAFLMSIALLALLVSGQEWAAAAPSPQTTTTCNTSFEYSGQWGTTGSGPGQFQAPVAVAVDQGGNVHVVDRDNRRIQKFNPKSDPPGTYLLEYGNEDGRVMLNPNGIEVGPRGNMYIADTDQHRILHYSDSGDIIGGWKDGDSSKWRLLKPWGVAAWDYDYAGNVYVVDRQTCNVLRFLGNGQFVDNWGHCDPAPYLPYLPQGVAVYPNRGNPPSSLYVADTGNHRVMKFDYRLTWLFNWGTVGAGDGQFNQPSSIATDADGCVYVADTGNHRIQVFNDQGVFQAKFGSPGSGQGQFQSPRGVALDSDGCVYVADTGNNRIQVFCPQLPPDVFIRDNITDTGTLPSPEPWWESPDVWVRHAPDGEEFPQPPIVGQTNYVYVHVHNLGDIPLEDVEVVVYCAPPSAAPPWPSAWHQIGSTPVSGMARQGETTVYVPWDPSGACLQILQDYDHLCLLVRLVTDQDPIQHEGSARWDNNITQLNVHQFENWPAQGNLSVAATINEDVIFLIGNPLDTSQTADIEFDRGDFPASGRLQIYLDETLFALWQAAGGSVEGGTVDPLQKKVEITATSMGVIRGLPLQAGQQVSTAMRITAASNEFFSVTVSELINGEYVGGNLYTTGYASHPEAVDLSAESNVMPPNSTQTITATVFGQGKMPAKDGTIVSFSTTLGAVTPNQTTTMGGIATTQLAAGGTTGIAQVSAAAAGVASEPLEIGIGNVVYLPLILKGSP
jgi:sugar lactone lactonase YvrE